MIRLIIVGLCLLILPRATQATATDLTGALMLLDTGHNLHLIDPVTLADLTSFAPIHLGDNLAWDIRDNRLVLDAASNTPNQTGDTILEIDLRTGERSEIAHTEKPIIALKYASSGLYWMQHTDTGTKIFRYEAGQTQQVGALPNDLVPGFDPPLAWGDSFIAVSMPRSSVNMAHGDPIDLDFVTADQIVHAPIPLHGAWYAQPSTNSTARMQFAIFQRAGLAWDEPHNRLLIVDSAADHLTEIDMALARIHREADLYTSDQAQRPANQVSGFGRAVRLNSTGSRLYIASWLVTPRSTTPLGIMVLDTSTLTAIARSPIAADHLDLTPDGRTLIATGVNGLYVLDAETLAVLARYLPRQTLVGFGVDGKRAYFGHTFAGENHLQAIDLATGKIIATRKLLQGGYVIGLDRPITDF
jgi:hypothetical protein